MLLFYIRHGDPIYAPNQLTPLGERQAEALAKRLALYGVDRIYSSTSNRAYQTAIPTAEHLKLPIEQLHWCNETLANKDTAILNAEGIKRWCWSCPEIVEKFNSSEVRALGKKWYEHPYFSEYREQFQNGFARVEAETYALLASLGYEHDAETCSYVATRPNDDRIALFAHEGFGKMFLSVLLDVPYPIYSTRFEISHSCVTVIEFPNHNVNRVFPRMLQLSNDSHLYREGLPTNYKNKIRF